MCGRYSFLEPSMIPFAFGADLDLLEGTKKELKKHYNVAPGMFMPVVVRNSPNHVELMRWGLVPSWAKDPKIGSRMINARAETVATKPSYRHAIKTNRCIVPASGFFEWKEAGDSKVPYYIHLKDREIFGFAGLYEIWHDIEGKELRTYTIITTEPNSLMESIHNRMPVILHKEDEDLWLDKEIVDPEKVLPLLKPYPAKEMTAYVVSKAVNSPRNDTEKVIQPER